MKFMIQLLSHSPKQTGSGVGSGFVGGPMDGRMCGGRRDGDGGSHRGAVAWGQCVGVFGAGGEKRGNATQGKFG